MTERISAERARRMLEAATPGPWEWRRFGLYRAHPDCRRESVVLREAGTFIRSDDGRLVAAAPDLCRTVIAQAEEIAALREVVEAARGYVATLPERDAPLEIDDGDAPDQEAALAALVAALARLDAMTEGS